eukprot:4009797-Heterocapsa_arctica.AAC.1
MKTEGKHTTKEEIGEGRGEKTCITCAARDETKGLKNTDFEINSSSIQEHWNEMKGNVLYKNWTTPQKID